VAESLEMCRFAQPGTISDGGIDWLNVKVNTADVVRLCEEQGWRCGLLRASVPLATGLPSGSAPDVPRRRLPDARLPELERFLLDFDRKQEIAGESRGGDAAWRAAQERFPDHIITRDMVRDARKAAGCIGKPGKKSIHAAK
jgi:hypothetical protein